MTSAPGQIFQASQAVHGTDDHKLLEAGQSYDQSHTLSLNFNSKIAPNFFCYFCLNTSFLLLRSCDVVTNLTMSSSQQSIITNYQELMDVNLQGTPPLGRLISSCAMFPYRAKLCIDFPCQITNVILNRSFFKFDQASILAVAEKTKVLQP